ncbi:unnamed protein product [Blepharisma stoltei]|uniref:F-box domain-containing protein n=1 Tax=Blepharisma stoltei TaxID=1481888 RepID=A0AAU9KDZ7_9CILI|nr:unnamed protein product [Blepharisma stoltei]
MDKIPNSILASILTIVGPFNEVVSQQSVCKKWKFVIEKAYHYLSFEGSRIYKLLPGNIDIDKMLTNHIKNYQFFSIDLKNVHISEETLAKVIFSNPLLLKLDISNNQIRLDILWATIDKSIQEDTKYFNLEELKLTNNRSSNLGSQKICEFFPRLKKLYLGHTKANFCDLIILIDKLNQLEILDVMMSKIYHKNSIIKIKEFEKVLTYSHIKRIFIEQDSFGVADILRNHNIEVVHLSFYDILCKLEGTAELKEWLRNGGDTNVISNKWKEWKYPQLQIINESEDEAILVEAYSLMIKHGLDLSNHIYFHNTTLLNAAIKKGFSALVKLLLNCGSDIWPVKYSNTGEAPALLEAVKSKNSLEIFQLFIDKGLHTQNYFSGNCNTICAALQENNLEMFNFLLENSVKFSRCRLHYNILASNQTILTKIIYSYADQFPLISFYEACQLYILSQQEDVALIILNYLISNEIANKENEILNEERSIGEKFHMRPIIILAVEKRMWKILQLITDTGFDINISDYYKWTPLMVAAACGHDDIVEFLCEKGARINEFENSGETALHQASRRGNLNAVNALIKYGADLSPKSAFDYTPLDLAIINQKEEIVNILQSYGADHNQTWFRIN